MPRTSIFDLTSLPPEYLDQAVAGLEVGREYPVRRGPWRRIPLDLLPLRSRRAQAATPATWVTYYFVLPHELAHAICQSIGGDCGCLDEEPITVWVKCLVVIRRHAMRCGR